MFYLTGTVLKMSLNYCIFYYLETPGHNSGWAETPRTDRTGGDLIQETPTPSASKRRSRWDETPSSQMTPGAMTPTTPGTPHTPHGTPHGTPHATPSLMTPSGVTPTGQKAMAMATPTPGMYKPLWNKIWIFYI